MTLVSWLLFTYAGLICVPEGSTYPPLPKGVSSFGAITCDGWLYVYGGHAVKTHEYSTASVLGTFHRLKLDGGREWEALPEGIPVQGLALAAHNGMVYRIGGMQPRNEPGAKADNVSLADCACYDPATKQWTPLPALPAGRSSHDAVVIGDRLFVVGGWGMNGAGNKSTWHEDVLVLDLSKKDARWVALKQPFKRRALVATTFLDRIYVVGGMDDENSVHLTVAVYDPAKNAWTTGPDLPGPKRNGFSPACCTSGAHLYVNTSDGKMWRLVETGDAWKEVGQVTQPRVVHRMVGAGERLVVVGGASPKGNVAATEAITPRN